MQNARSPSRNAASDEDWRPRLQAMIGTWTFTPPAGQGFTQTCRWIPDASFVACSAEGQPILKLFGWEQNNRRYVLWAVDLAGGEVTVVPGTLSNAEWVFEGRVRADEGLVPMSARGVRRR